MGSARLLSISWEESSEVLPFRIELPLVESKIRELTECSVVAIKVGGVMTINPDPQVPIQENTELILVGNYEGEKKFLQWTEE